MKVAEALPFFLTVAVTAAQSQRATRTVERAAKPKPRLSLLPLIAGDSPEARRRRRQRRRRLDDKKSNSEDNSKGEEEELLPPLISEEAGEGPIENENPLELYRDVLYEGYGVHYVDLWVGCPQPQRVTVIVDTGSSVTGFPCTGCSHCGGSGDAADGDSTDSSDAADSDSADSSDSDSDHHKLYHTDALFRQDDSTCFEVVQSEEDCLVGDWNKEKETCRTSKHYSEGSSWEAFEATDQVYTGGNHNAVDSQRKSNDSFRLHFGCQDSVAGLFETQLADGIMGMYRSKESFWSQMYAEQKLEKQAFSLCYAEPGHVEREGTMAGAMVLGGSDTRLHKTPMIYAQEMSPFDGKFKVHLEKVYLQEASSNNDDSGEEFYSTDLTRLNNVQIFEEALNNKGPVIIDSGTTATYLTKQLQNHFVDVFNSIVSKDVMVLVGDKPSAKHALTFRQLEQLPTIVFMVKAWDPSVNDGNENESVAPPATIIPGMVGKDLDPKRAGKSILVRMPPLNYMSRVENDSELDISDLDAVAHYQFNVFFTKKSGGGAVLGANFMRGHDVLFDMDSNRIGFAVSTCEYEALADDEEAG